MTDEDYLWDRSGESDDFLARLERGLALLGDEGEAMLAGLDDGAAGLELEEPEAERSRAGAVILELPVAGAPIGVDARARSSSWAWLSAAAAVLLVFSAWVFGASARRLDLASASVSGAAIAATRVEVGVLERDTELGVIPMQALVELRVQHLDLGRCARGQREVVELEVELGLHEAGAVDLRAIAARRGQLDAPVRACLVETLGEWEPAGFGVGELKLKMTIVPRGE